MIRNNEDFPEPFEPITPIFAPGRRKVDALEHFTVSG